MQRKKVAILRNELLNDHKLWVDACEKYSDAFDYTIIDLTAHDWYEKITSQVFDCLLAKPPGLTAKFKQLYDERIFIIDNVLRLRIYPTPLEIYIYENKRFFASWLKANMLPHPKTYCFYHQEKALSFLESTSYPLIAKANIGASGSGVKILRNHQDATAYVDSVFSSKGAPKRWGPNMEKGSIIKRGLHYLLYPGDIRKKMNLYHVKRNEVQIGFVILQEYIPHDYEWRVVAIGSSYFAHKKLKVGEKASGSLLKNYDNVPLKLLDFARAIMERFGFYSQALDIFETVEGNFLINEMQCVFGQSDPYQMLVDGKPGRYSYLDNNWLFEAGMFNTNASYDLRLEHIMRLLNK